MNKKGQFFIIAAILIVLVIFGMASISTYAITRPEPRTLSDLSSELNREGFKVIEYGIYNKENLEKLTDSFTGEDIAKYFLKKTDNANIVFVYGDKTNLNSMHYIGAKTGSITIGGSNFVTFSQFSKKGKPKIEGDFAIVNILGNDYRFELKENEMFYFVIVQKKGEEVFVEKSDKK